MINGIENNQICFLLLPGFAPDNFPMLGLKRELEEAGYTAIATPFWGEKENINFYKLTIEDCKEGVKALIEKCKKQYPVVVGIGVSLGGALFMEYAKEGSDLDYIVSIGTPFKLRNKKFISLGIMIHPICEFVWEITQRISPRILPPLPATRMAFGYLNNEFTKGLEKNNTPTLLIQSKKDYVTDTSVTDEYLAKFSCQKKKAIYFENVGHALDYNNDIILKSLQDFINDSERVVRPRLDEVLSPSLNPAI